MKNLAAPPPKDKTTDQVAPILARAVALAGELVWHTDLPPSGIVRGDDDPIDLAAIACAASDGQQTRQRMIAPWCLVTETERHDIDGVDVELTVVRRRELRAVLENKVPDESGWRPGIEPHVRAEILACTQAQIDGHVPVIVTWRDRSRGVRITPLPEPVLISARVDRITTLPGWLREREGAR